MAKRKIIIIALAILVLVVVRQYQEQDNSEYYQLVGTTMGSITYSVKYVGDESQNFQIEVDQILIDFNQSLSTYIPSSEVSMFNRIDSITYQSPYMYPILQMSKKLFTDTKGAYDPTIGPLVNAWGFGPTKKSTLDSALVDSLLQIVNFDLVKFDRIKASKTKGSYLDFSASAKGYAVDVIADFLTSQGIENYMIEIGGEVRCHGFNQNQTVWNIGIERPAVQVAIGDLYATVFVKNQSLATSGNYHNYYQSGGQIISHTISPFTGYNVTHNLLSASIFAPNCTLADGYATACMVKGLDASIEMVEKLEGVEGFFIYSNDDGSLASYATAGISNQVKVLK